MKRTKFFCATLISVFALFAFFSCSNPANSGTPSSTTKARGAKIVNVTYDANGGGQLNKSVYDYALGNPIGTEMPVATRAGYVFTGWNTKANGTGDVFNKNTILTDSITVYAQWTFRTAPFSIAINYSQAEVSITNSSLLPDTATVALTDTQLTITATPLPVETPYYDFVGYFDADDVRVCDQNRNLIPNTKYADNTGKWIYDPDYEGVNLVIYPRWYQNIKATSVTLDHTTYNAVMGDTFTVSGHYEPANATVTITNPFENFYYNGYDQLLITKNFVCDNGTFSIEFKALKPFSDTFTFSCVKYPSTSYAECTINVQFPNAATLAALPSVSAVSYANHTEDGPAIGNSSSTNRYDFTGYEFDSDSDTVYKLYKVNLTANKNYIFEMSDSCSTTVDGIENYIDACVYIYDQYGNSYDFDSGENILDDNYDYFTPTTTGTYYIMLSRLSVSYLEKGYAGFHIYLNCITDIALDQPANTFDAARYDYFTGTYFLKPFESLRFDINYTPYHSNYNPTVWLGATVTNTDIVSMDDSHIDPINGKYITLTANKPGTTEIVVADDYSGFGIHYFLKVITDNEEVITPTDTVGSTNYNDYEEMLFDDGLNATKWYKLYLTGGHRYFFESGKYVSEIYDAIGSADYTDIDLYVYDSDFNCLIQQVHEFPCLTTGYYYICYIPEYTDKKNAFHIYDMGAINTSIELPKSVNLTAGSSVDISLTFNNGAATVSSDFSCSLVDGVQHDTTNITRFVSVKPYESSPDDITITGKSNGRNFTFSGQPTTLTVKGMVPGKTKLIFTDVKAEITKEVIITVTTLTTPETLTLQYGPEPYTTILADYDSKQLSSSGLYGIFSATLKEGVKYYFRPCDADYVPTDLEEDDMIDAHFYLEDADKNILGFTDGGTNEISTISYTCTATGTYYLVFTYRTINPDSLTSLSTGYAGVRLYAEKITSMSDYLTSSQYFFLDADGLTHNITNDFQYTPTNAYYNFIVSNTEDSRIVGNATVANSTRLRLNPYMPGITYVTVRDQYSGVEHDYYFKVFPVEDDIPELPINYSAPDDIDDIMAEDGDTRVIADLYSNYYEIYSMQLVKNAVYHFLLADNNDQKGMSGTSDCQFYIEDSQYNVIHKADTNDTTFADFTCPETGTYYFIIARNTMITNGSSTAGGVYAYCDPITAIDSSNTLSTINLPLGGQTTFTVPFEPATAACDFVISANSSDTRWTYDCWYMLNFDTSTDEIAATGNTFTLESLGEYSYSNSPKYLLWDIPVTITDTISGISKNVIIHIVPDPMNTQLISSVPTGRPEVIDDYYNKIISQTNPAAVYSVSLQADTKYSFAYQNYEYSNFIIYDSNLIAKETWSSSGSGIYTYTPSTSGTYYIVICAYYSNRSPYNSYFYVFQPNPITSISLSSTSETLQIGQSTQIQYSYSPESNDAVINVQSSDSRVVYTYTYGNTITIYTSSVPGTATIEVRDSISGLFASCNVTVLPDLSTVISVTPDTTNSTDINDYEVAYLDDTTTYVVYKLQLQNGKTYHFENNDRYNQPVPSWDGVLDCYFYLRDSNFAYVKHVDDGNMVWTCNATGTYYYVVTTFSGSGTGKGAFHVYAE